MTLIDRSCRFLVIALLCSNAWFSHAYADDLPLVVRNALRQEHIPEKNVGVYVQEADAGGKTLVSYRAKMPFMPASVMKLVTTDAALELLGPTFRWKTQVYIDGELNDGVLHGNLIIKGSGDPKLVIENIWLFLQQIRDSGVREIRGNVVLDRGVFEDMSYDPAQFDGDPQKPYNVGPDALLMNYKALAFRFIPNPTNGTVNVTSEPVLADYAIHAPKLATAGACGDWESKLDADVGAEGAAFNGSFPAACGEKQWYVSPYKMTATRYFDAVFRHLWQELGGTLGGQVVSGSVSPAARLLAQWQSPTLPEVIRDINKYSNNVMARQVLLSLPSAMSTVPTTMTASTEAANVASGTSIIKNWLMSKGIDGDGVVIENGAGLSRNERISPLVLGQVLSLAFRSPLMPEFMSSLPLAGVDGTMRHRVQNQTVAGHAHIKTGSLNDVRSIAGYVQAASGKYFIVVFLINDPSAQAGQHAQDALLQWVYENH